jgi:hypothetical protein
LLQVVSLLPLPKRGMDLVAVIPGGAMQKSKPENLTRPKHAHIQRDAMEDIKEQQSLPNSGEIHYRDPNRDRARGEADRTGRHFDEEQEIEDAGDAASEDHEAD